MQGSCQRTQECGFTQPWNTLQKDVAGGQKANQDAFDDVVLADYDFCDFSAYRRKAVYCQLQLRFASHVFIVEQ